MKHSNWQNCPKYFNCAQSIQNYGFNQFLEIIRSWSPLNSSLRCSECEKEKKGESLKKMKKVDLALTDKFLWVCLECSQIFCGAEKFNLRQPYSHISFHAIGNKHMLAIPIAAWCLACKSIHPIVTVEANKDLETIKEMDSAIIEEGIGGRAVWSLYNLDGDYVVKPLQNLGNTCFFNAILQNLLSMTVLRREFQQIDFQPQSVSKELRSLFLKTNTIVEDVDSIINPYSLFKSFCSSEPSFCGYEQHDSSEFLKKLLNVLLDEKTSFIQGIFGGVLSNTLSCLQCAKVTKSYEDFLDLSLAIPSNKLASASCDSVPRKRPRMEGQAQSGNNNGDPKTIEDCLGFFIESEIVFVEQPCGHCSTPSLFFYKSYRILKAPNVLTIHLKRFTHDTSKGIIEKNISHINIPELLDLTPYMDPSCVDKEKHDYQLIGVVEHLGAGLNGGHYVAYVKGIRRRQGRELAWFRASDAVVQEVSLDIVLGVEAYILFYERMGS